MRRIYGRNKSDAGHVHRNATVHCCVPLLANVKLKEDNVTNTPDDNPAPKFSDKIVRELIKLDDEVRAKASGRRLAVDLPVIPGSAEDKLNKLLAKMKLKRE